MRKNEEKIAIYSRKSKFTGKGESIGNQIELCKDYIRNMFGEKYVELCEVFEDEGFSGGNLKRPAFQRMMAEVRKRKFKAIVVYRLDRISRNISDFTGLIDELTKLDVSFVSIREQFDTSTPMGRAMMFIISVFSQLERETIAERIRDNMHELAKTGRWLGGNAPLGYRSKPVSKITIDGKERKSFCLEPVPEEIDIPKLIYDLYTQSDSLTAVEAELLRRRIKTKLGKNFSRFAIKAILQNPVYMVADEDAYDFFLERKAEVCFPKSEFDGSCGIMAYNRTDQEKGRAMILLPMEEWIIALGKHPGIVPSKQWIAVQQSLERNKSKGYRKPRNNEALLTGLIYCSCGERMYPKLTERRTGSGELIYTYVCKMKERSKRTRCNKRNANGNILDAAIIEQLKTLTEKDSAFMKQMEKSRQFYTGNREQYDTQLTKLREELAQNEKIVAGLLDSLGLVGDSIARPSMLRRIEELTEANRVIDCQIRELEGLVTANHLSGGEFDLLRQILAMFRENVDQMSIEEKRAAVRTVVRKVIWDGENAHVILFGAEDGDLDYPNIDERLSEAGEDDENDVEDLVDIECEESDINDAFIEENGTFAASKSRWGDGSK
nr:MAG TPA: integrase [Caudoviricetes sp.]